MGENGETKYTIESSKWENLKFRLSGDLHYSHTMRTLYATDASSYRMLPAAVALPKTHDDIRQLVKFAIENDIPLIPRAAGTSLSGQPIGKGIVVDVGRYMNQVLEVNKEESLARIQPGVIRNELNEYLEPYGLFFGP